MTPQKCLKILNIFLRLPGILAFFVLVNTMKLLAPDFTFRMMKQRFEKTGTRETAEKFKSIEDIEYIISFACVKVQDYRKIKTIKADMFVLEKVSLRPGGWAEGG